MVNRLVLYLDFLCIHPINNNLCGPPYLSYCEYCHNKQYCGNIFFADFISSSQI